MAFSRAEVEREALAHHEAHHADLHNSAGREFERAAKTARKRTSKASAARRIADPDAVLLGQLLTLLRSDPARFCRVPSVGYLRASVGPRKRLLVVNALEVLAADATSPELQRWAVGLLTQWANQAQAA